MSRSRARLFSSLFAMLLSSCTTRCTSEEVPELEASISGCDAWRGSTVCELDASQLLRIRVRDVDRVRVSIGERSFEDRGLIEVPAPIDRDPLTLRIEAGGRARVVRVERRSDPPLERAWRLRGSKPEEAMAIAREVATSTSTLRRARALSLRARLEREAGAFAKAEETFAESIGIFRALDRGMEASMDGFALAYMQIYDLRALSRAERSIDTSAASRPKSPEEEAMAPYFRGLLALQLADLRRSMYELEKAETLARDMKWTRVVTDAWQLRSQVLLLLGRHDEACALLEQSKSMLAELSSLEQAQLFNNLGWAGIAALEAGSRSCPHPRAALEDALARFKAANNRREAANVLINLALVALFEQDLERAVAVRDEALKLMPDDPLTRAWCMFVDMKLLAAHAQPQRALELARNLGAIARASIIPDLIWRIELERARALHALDRRKDALVAYEDARGAIVEESRFAPLGEGHASFLNRFQMIGREHVGLLLQLQRTEEALAKARLYRAQHFDALAWSTRIGALSGERRASWENAVGAYRALMERVAKEASESWSLSRDQLAIRVANRKKELERVRRELEASLALGSQPIADRDEERGTRAAEGELLLAFYPLSEDWAVFTKLGSAAPAVAHVANGPAERVVERALEAASAAIEHARRVRVLSSAELDAVDVHAVSYRGAPLIVHAEVSYGADLPVRELKVAQTATRAEYAGAIVVGDPTGTLPHALAEASTVARSLERALRPTSTLLQRQATLVDTRRALEDPRMSLFFFAGHGRLEGRDNWESGLELFDGRLGIADVLALSHVPKDVVLAGCDTGRTQDESGAIGVGIAHAFLANGARVVIATERPLIDRHGRSLFGAILADGTGDLVAALRRAQIDAIHRGESEWSNFRAIVP